MRKFILWATTNLGQGFVTKIGEYQDVEDISIRIGMFSPNVVITIEEEWEKEEDKES